MRTVAWSTVCNYLCYCSVVWNWVGYCDYVRTVQAAVIVLTCTAIIIPSRYKDTSTYPHELLAVKGASFTLVGSEACGPSSSCDHSIEWRWLLWLFPSCSQE